MSSERLLRQSAALLDEPIVAVSTAPGVGAIGTVRLSGSAEAIDSILDRVLGADARRALIPRRATLLLITDPRDGEPVDRGLVVRFVGPASYTGEDVVELDLHGSPVLLRQAQDALCAAGARPAGPGEFTRRAVIHGRMGLVQAEAVDALVKAESVAAARMAGRHLGGELSERLRTWREGLLGVAAALEARVDFPEEIDDDELDPEIERLDGLVRDMGLLASSFDAGRRLVEGTHVALVGPVNAGKSTLFNALLGHRRAITSELAGTTRDVVSETVTWSGRAFRLEDTAGIRPAADSVEAEGIERSAAAQRAADVVVMIRDAREIDSGPAPAGSHIAVATHADLLEEPARAALREAGWLLSSLPAAAEPDPSTVREAIVAAASEGTRGGELLLHTARQHAALRRALEALVEAQAVGADEPVLAAVAVRAAGRALEELTGRWEDEEVLDSLFERFCIGK